MPEIGQKTVKIPAFMVTEILHNKIVLLLYLLSNKMPEIGQKMVKIPAFMVTTVKKYDIFYYHNSFQ